MSDQMTGVKYVTICDRCNACQNICEVGSQYVRDYTPVPSWPCIEKDQIIGRPGDNYWNRDNWIDLLEYIDNARFYLSQGNSATKTLLKPLHGSEKFLTAEAFNNAAKALNSGQIIKGSDTSDNKKPSIQVKKDVDLVKGSYLAQLLQEAENLKFGTFQCNDCVTSGEKETHEEERPAPCGNCCDCKEKSDKG